jgi:hypothetical protein
MPAGTPSPIAMPRPIAQPWSVLPTAFHISAVPTSVISSPIDADAGGMLVSGISPARTIASHRSSRSSTATTAGAHSARLLMRPP